MLIFANNLAENCSARTFQDTGTPANFRGVKNNLIVIPYIKPVQLQFERAKIESWTLSSGNTNNIKLQRDGSVLTVIASGDSSVFVKLVDETVYPLTFHVVSNTNVPQLYIVSDSGDISGDVSSDSDQEAAGSERDGDNLVMLDGEAYGMIINIYNMEGAGKYRIEQKNGTAGAIGRINIYYLYEYTSEHYTGIAYLLYNGGQDVIINDGDIKGFTFSEGVPVAHQIDAYHIDSGEKTRLIVIYMKMAGN